MTHPAADRPASPPTPRSGFTLVELLVALAIIALLVALLLPSLAGVRGSARAARELAAAQQQITAFALYADDHRGEVLPGYAPSWMVLKDPPPRHANDQLVVHDESGSRIFGTEARRFPWRLAPYLSFNFRGLYQSDDLLEQLRARPEDFRYVVSLFPSLGMNVEFVGGSSYAGLGFNPDILRIYGPFYVTKMHEPRRPDALLVFASARAPDSARPHWIDAPLSGFYRLDSPILTASAGRRWDDAFDPDTPEPGINSGFVDFRLHARARRAAAAAMFDGHAAPLTFDDLADMRRWCNLATSPDWGLAPR